MSNLPTKIEKSPEYYNSEPVFYCKHCLSLKVLGVEYIDDAEYCDECGSTNIEKTTIEEWEKLYKGRYGVKYLENNY